ncbi:MAG: hypothetical protein ABI611_03155 [Solirubrobacteraceae bacterium]
MGLLLPAGAPRAVVAHPHRRADRRGRRLDLAEEAGQVAGKVVERAAGRDDVDEAEQRRLELTVLGGELHRLLVGELERVARRCRHGRGQPLADGEQLLLQGALLDHRADDTLALMRIAVAADERTGVAGAAVELQVSGFRVSPALARRQQERIVRAAGTRARQRRTGRAQGRARASAPARRWGRATPADPSRAGRGAARA